MKIIRSYILRENIVPFFMALGVLTCVMLLGNLIKLAHMVINKGVSIKTVGVIFILYVPVLLGYTIPIACLIAVITSFSRLSTDNEILALRASGIHLSRLLYPLLVVGLILSLFSIVLNEKIIPYAHHKQRSMIKNLGAENPTALIEPGVQIDGFKDQILWINKINGNKLANITIFQTQSNGLPRTIISKRGEFTPVPGKNMLKLKLMDGTMEQPSIDNPETFYKLNFDTYFIDLDLAKKAGKIKKKPKSMTFAELREGIEELESKFYDTSRYNTEIWRKITWSFAPLFFIILGFPLAVITHRREKSANVVIAIVFGVAYYLLSLGCEGMSKKNVLPAYVIMWAPNFIALTLGIYLNKKCVS